MCYWLFFFPYSPQGICIPVKGQLKSVEVCMFNHAASFIRERNRLEENTPLD